MPSIGQKLRSRILSRDTDDWNHRRRMLALIPVWSVLGYTIGYFGGVHWLPPAVPDAIVPGLFAVIGILGGSAFMALID
jgi:hypothetical protein